MLTCAPIGNRRKKKSGLTTRCRMPSYPTVLRVGSGRLGAVLIRQFRLVQLQRRAPAPVADGEANGLQSRDWVFESLPECQFQRARGREDSGSGLLNRNTLVRFQPGVPTHFGFSCGHQSTAGWPPYKGSTEVRLFLPAPTRSRLMRMSRRLLTVRQ